MSRTILRKGGSGGSGRVGGAAPREPAVVPWQMTVLGESASGGPAAQAEPPAPPPRPPEEELALIRETARAQGHAEGLAAGRADAAREATELLQLLGRLREVMDGFEHDLALDVLALSVEVARQIIRHAVHVHPEVVLPVIREAIASLPQGGGQNPRLILNPADAALVRSVLDANQVAPAPWRIVEDSRLERGGCRVETATSEIDASLASRWKAVVAALGSEARWVDMEAPERAAGDTAAPPAGKSERTAGGGTDIGREPR